MEKGAEEILLQVAVVVLVVEEVLVVEVLLMVVVVDFRLILHRPAARHKDANIFRKHKIRTFMYRSSQFSF